MVNNMFNFSVNVCPLEANQVVPGTTKCTQFVVAKIIFLPWAGKSATSKMIHIKFAQKTEYSLHLLTEKK